LRQRSSEDPQNDRRSHGQAESDGCRIAHALEDRPIPFTVVTEHDQEKRESANAAQPVKLTGRKEHQGQSGGSHCYEQSSTIYLRFGHFVS
jgi:hypothetical protein